MSNTTTNPTNPKRGDCYYSKNPAFTGIMVITDANYLGRSPVYQVRHGGMTGHDLERGYEGLVAPTFGRKVAIGDTLRTPQGTGKVVGFHKSICRIVQVPGVNGAHAINPADCHEAI